MRRLVALAFLLMIASPAAGIIVITPGTTYILGPTTPQAHSSRGMVLHLNAHTVRVGGIVKGKGGPFIRGEYVTVWEYRGRHSSQLLGGTANSGWLNLIRTPARPGRARLCLQGERSRRVACASYRIIAPPSTPATNNPGTGQTPGPADNPGWAPPTTGPGFLPPSSG